MKLVARGVSDDYNPPEVAIQEDTVTGKFRGKNKHVIRYSEKKKQIIANHNRTASMLLRTAYEVGLA